MIRFSRRAYPGRWTRTKFPGGARPQRNAVRRLFYTATDLRKAEQLAQKWEWVLETKVAAALRRDVADVERGHRSRANRDALARIGVYPSFPRKS